MYPRIEVHYWSVDELTHDLRVLIRPLMLNQTTGSRHNEVRRHIKGEPCDQSDPGWSNRATENVKAVRTHVVSNADQLPQPVRRLWLCWLKFLVGTKAALFVEPNWHSILSDDDPHFEIVA